MGDAHCRTRNGHNGCAAQLVLGTAWVVLGVFGFFRTQRGPKKRCPADKSNRPGLPPASRPAGYRHPLYGGSAPVTPPKISVMPGIYDAPLPDPAGASLGCGMAGKGGGSPFWGKNAPGINHGLITGAVSPFAGAAPTMPLHY